VKPAPAGNLLTFLSQVPDPRGRQGRRHPLEAMLASIVCAMLQGARGYDAIAEWVRLQEVELWHVFGFTRTPPKAGAFRKLLMALSPTDFERVLTDWAKYCLGMSTEKSLEAVALDGKTLCGTLQPHERAVHLLAFLDQRTGCVLSQVRVDAKTNEHKAALELFKTLVLEGRVITGDAMFCQREVCQEIRDRGGHYFFTVKDNQPTLKEAIAAEFKAAFSPCDRTATASHSGCC
jgi:DDE_Tnp_1-associated/Transposase DDE domain